MNRLLFREARLSLVIWFVGICVLIGANVAGIIEMFNTNELWAEYVKTLRTPFAIVFAGPGIGLDANHIDFASAVLSKVLVMLCIAIVIFNVNYSVNWNRGFEEDGRTELLLALPVKRYSLQKASIINLSIFNFLVSAALLLCFLVAGFAVFDTIVTTFAFFLFCELWMLIGILSSALFAVARSAKFATNGLFLGLYLVGALGWVEGCTKDVSAIIPDLPIYCWLSPVHWIFEIKPFVDLNFAPLFLLLVLVILLSFIVIGIFSDRDMGKSLIASKVGKRGASNLLNSFFALRFRQIRWQTLIWAIALSGLATAYGSMAKQVIEIVSSSDLISKMMKSSPQQAAQLSEQMTASTLNSFLSFILLFLNILISAYIITQINAVLVSDEKRGLQELALSKPIGRLRYLFESQLISVICLKFVSFSVLSAFCLIIKQTVSDANIGDLFTFGVILMSISFFFFALSILLYSINYKLFPYAWGYFGFCIVIMMFSDIFKTPTWFNNLAITNHFSNFQVDMSFDNQTFTASIVVSALSVLFLALSYIFYSRRDL